MIYLLDDNQHNQRANNYNLTFIEEGVFDGYLKSISKIETGTSLADLSHLEFLTSAKCILVHSTMEDYDSSIGFLSGSTTNMTKIKEEISSEGDKIPLVIFSNSMGEADCNLKANPNYIRGIKKNLFYERLYDFLLHYRDTDELDLRIIASGVNYMSIEVTKLGLEILGAIQVKKNSDRITLSDLSEVLSSFKLFLDHALPETTIEEILNDIEDSTMSILVFRRKINQITESYSKYGKNIYSWK